MTDPHVYIAFAPRGPGVMWAMLYIEVTDWGDAVRAMR